MDEPRAPRAPIAANIFDRPEADHQLPRWARRGHPIVRRQLGVFWKVMTPDLRLVWQAYLLQIIFVALTLVFPFLFTLLLPVIIVPILLLPFSAVAYAGALYRIGASAAAGVADERRAERFDLLRLTPMTLGEILAAKGAAALWRQIETLDLIVTTVAFLSLPMVLILNTSLMTGDQTLASRLILIAGLTTSLLRVLVEPPMMAVLGLLMGTVTRERIPAMLATGALGFAYFVLINLPRLAPLPPLTRVFVEMVLPLILPLIIIVLTLGLATRLLARE
jgi:hypothetical protein